MNYDHQPQKVLCFGKSGMGKTRFATAFVRKSAFNCYFVFDHAGQFSWRNKIKPAASIAELDGQFARRFVIFDPSMMFPGNTTGAFQFFCEWSFDRASTIRGRKLLFLDEIQSYANRYKIEWELALVLETGRHAGLDFIGCTLAPNRINDAVRGQATEWVTFKLNDETQVAPLLDLGFDRERVMGLDQLQFISRTDNGDEREGKL